MEQVTAAELLDVLWRDHVALAPDAARIHQLLTEHGEVLVHDHVAFSTFAGAGPMPDIDALARPFVARGWRPRERFQAADHLRAGYWQHDDPALPKLWLGELAADALPAEARAVIAGLVAQLPPGFAGRDDLAWAGRPWQLTHADYATLEAASPDAAWIAAFGFRVHHFTVDVDSLAAFPDLEALAAFLAEHGFPIDGHADGRSGGMISGSRAQWLEQVATRRGRVPVAFADGTVRVAGCRYELARRYVLPSGERFHGFLSAERSGTPGDLVGL